MRVRGIGRIRHVAETTARRFAAGVRVLLYHRVADLSFDPQWLAVRPSQFDEQMRIVRKKFNPLSVDELLKGLAENKMPRNAVLVTFDDGYADNYTEAKPILEKWDVPAVVFVTSGNIGAKSEFWWDELERLLFTSEKLPENLALTIGGESFLWTLADRKYNRAAPDHWDVFQSEIPSERHRLYRELSRLMKELIPPEREEILGTLANWVGDQRVPRTTHVSMTPDELRTLSGGGLVAIGAHTMRHPKLSRQCVADQAVEIQGSKRDLEEMLGKTVDTFSYPFGGDSDFSNVTTAILSDSGFRCAFSAMPRCVRRDAKVFEIPRFFVRDWDGDKFEEEMSAFAAR